MSGEAVTTHGITKRYGQETALDGVSLRVPEGAVYVLVGANGAGKSTTLKVLMNLERADSGTAEIPGHSSPRSRGPCSGGLRPGATGSRLPLDDVQ
jgi:ABC-type multidrug transport system ATPase subunit